MPKGIKSDKSKQRALVQAFREVHTYGVAKCEGAITETNLRVCDRKSILLVRDLYVAAAGDNAKADKLELLDKWADVRLRQSPNNRPTPEEVEALFSEVEDEANNA